MNPLGGMESSSDAYSIVSPSIPQFVGPLRFHLHDTSTPKTSLLDTIVPCGKGPGEEEQRGEAEMREKEMRRNRDEMSFSVPRDN